MRWLQPTPPPYDPLQWEKLEMPERGRQVCRAWAAQGYGAPLATYLAYALKVALYVAGWSWWCARTPGLGGLAELPRWWLEPVAFQKAILWSMLFEGLGLGCGSGPLTGRYLPPLGGALYFLRPGTTKAALWPRAPVVGGVRRSWLDVSVYAAILGVLVVGLWSPTPPRWALLAVVGLVPLAGVCDRTLFLALRSEHYWVTVACFAFAERWLAGAMAVQLALWWWAGVSKLTAHFPAVVCVMVSNSPVLRWRRLRRAMYRRYPDDLRPSRLAVGMSHVGTALELGIPTLLLLSPAVPSLGPVATVTVALVLVLVLHGFITSNVPMGVPIEWNVMVVYGAFALFGAHPEVSLAELAPWPLVVALLVALVAVPLAGNLWPSRISFLPAMRYYAGNWAFSVWLFSGDSHRKLSRCKASSPWVYDQLARLYDRRTAVGLFGKVLGFRLMHLHGRVLPRLLPRATPSLASCQYVDGEVVAGLVLGWNFGDGHLHREDLLAAVQAQCQFAPGELRCIFVEAQALGGRALPYRIVDAAAGRLEAGEVAVSELLAQQPWSAPGDVAAAPGEPVAAPGGGDAIAT